MKIGRTGTGAIAHGIVNAAKKAEGGLQRPASYSRSLMARRRASIPEQKDTQAWQEIQRQRDLGRSDQDIWFNAVREGDLEVVGAFIRKPPQGFDVNRKDGAGTDVLSIAASARNNAREMVELLVGEGGVDVPAQPDDGNGAEQDSPGSADGDGPGNAGLQSITNHLNGKLNDGLKDALAAAAAAASAGQEGIGASPGKTWFEAIETGDVDAMRDLIKNPPEGWDVNAQNDEGMTALQWSVRYGSAEMVETLVTEGDADITTRDEMGRNAIELAEELRGDLERKNSLFGSTDTTTEFDAKIERMRVELNRDAKAAFEENDLDRYTTLLDAGAKPPANGPSEIVTELPDLDDLDVNNLATSEKDDDGNPLTVNELTVREIMDEYKKGIDDGAIGKDDPRARFYYAMNAQNDLDYGKVIIPYREDKQLGGSERYEGEPISATREDMADFYDPEEVRAAFAETSTNETVMKDWAEAQSDAIDKLPKDRETYKAEIEKTLLSDDFKNYLGTLKLEGKRDEAVSAVQRGLSAYSAVASEDELNDLASRLGTKELVEQLEGILSDPGEIEDEYWESAVQDWAAYSLEAANRGIQLGLHGLNSIELAEQKEFFKALLKKDSPELRETAAVFREASKAANPKMSATELDKVIDKALEDDRKPWGVRGKVRAFFTRLNKAGASATAIGMIALTGSIYEMTKGNAFSDDHMQNMQIARNFLLFLGTTPEIAKLGSRLTRAPSIAKFLGSGDTAAIFGSASVKSIFKVGDAEANFAKWLDSRPFTHLYPETMLGRISEKLDGHPDHLKTKISASAIRVMGATTFTGFGIVDLALGGLSIDEGVKAGDDLTIAQGSLQILTGGFTTAAGGAWGLSVAGASAAGAFVSPFLAVAAILGIVIIGIDIIRGIVSAIKNEDDIATAKQLEYFEQMGEMGLLQDDWREKYEFMVKSFYGEDNPEGKDAGVDSERPRTKEGESVFGAFDWKAWLADYEQEYEDLGYTSLDEGGLQFPYPPSHRTGTRETTDEDLDDSLNAAVSIYHDRIDVIDRKVPILDGELKEEIKEMIRYYFENVNINGRPEHAANWVNNKIGSRLPGAYPDGPGNTQYDEEDDGKRALGIYDNNFRKHGGRETLAEIAEEVLEADYG